MQTLALDLEKNCREDRMSVASPHSLVRCTSAIYRKPSHGDFDLKSPQSMPRSSSLTRSQRVLLESNVVLDWDDDSEMEMNPASRSIQFVSSRSRLESMLTGLNDSRENTYIDSSSKTGRTFTMSTIVSPRDENEECFEPSIHFVSEPMKQEKNRNLSIRWKKSAQKSSTAPPFQKMTSLITALSNRNRK
mmetsp:Transcript_3124/g.5498  ORF Transcript_3124/g.5498 Transcript_3124/m.5498 type:complete len:190 (-) Transcript_3124:31-600(-)